MNKIVNFVKTHPRGVRIALVTVGAAVGLGLAIGTTLKLKGDVDLSVDVTT